MKVYPIQARKPLIGASSLNRRARINEDLIREIKNKIKKLIISCYLEFLRVARWDPRSRS